jgi:hypothetical protein
MIESCLSSVTISLPVSIWTVGPPEAVSQWIIKIQVKANVELLRLKYLQVLEQGPTNACEEDTSSIV